MQTLLTSVRERPVSTMSPSASLPPRTRPPGSCNTFVGRRCGRTPEIRRGSLAGDARAGAPAHGRGGATRAPQPAQAAALRSPRRHAQRPRHPLDRKESIYSRNILRLRPVHFCKPNPICCRIFRCLSVEGCRLPTTDTSEIDGPDADIPIDVNDPGLDVAVDRQIGALRRGSRTQVQLRSTGQLMKPQLRDRSFRSPRPSRVP
jgi:hypothetical protein